MFVLTEKNLRAMIAPVTPSYAATGDWMRLSEEDLQSFGDIYRFQPSVRSVVDFIAGHCARMPIKLFKQEGGGTGDSNEGDREHLRIHPLQKLLNVPAGTKLLGRSAFWEDAWKDYLIYDRVCLVKIRSLDTNNPIAMIRVPPMWFAPYGGSYFHPEGISIIGNRGSYDLRAENVIYIHGYEPADPRIGSSPMLSLKAALQEEAAGNSWRNRFWSQGVQASMVVTRPIEAPEWDDGARDRFIESLRAASSRGRPLLLEEGMSVNPAAAFDPKSAEYIQSKKFTREEVLRVYNLPVGLFEQQSSANIAQYRAMLYSETLAPLLGRFIDELEAQLLTEWTADAYDDGLYLEPAIEEKLRGNIMEQIVMFTAATGGPIMLRSEARAFMNLKTLTDDKAKPDKLIIPSSAVVDGEPAGGTPPSPFGGGAGLPPTNDPNSSKPKNPANQNGPAKPPQENDPTTAADENPSRHPGRTSGKRLDDPDVRAGYDEVSAQLALQKDRSARDKRAHERFQKEATTKLTSFAKRQASSSSSSGKFNKSRWDKELAADLAPLRQGIAKDFGERAAERWDSEFDAERMKEYNDAGAEKQASFLNELSEANFNAYHDLGDYSELGQKLVERMEQAAVDTVNHMAAFGAFEAAKQTGRDVKKAWRTLSGNPRPTHDKQDGEEVSLHETFSNGLRYPHDPAGPAEETAGCQCEIEFSVSDEVRPADEEPE